MSSIIKMLDDEFDYLGEEIAMSISRDELDVQTNSETGEDFYLIKLPFALPEDKSERKEVFKWLKESIQETFNGLDEGYELMTEGRDPDDTEEDIDFDDDDEYAEEYGGDEYAEEYGADDEEEYYFDKERGCYVSEKFLEEERRQKEAAEEDARRYDDDYDKDAPMRIKVVDSTHIQLYL